MLRDTLLGVLLEGGVAHAVATRDLVQRAALAAPDGVLLGGGSAEAVVLRVPLKVLADGRI